MPEGEERDLWITDGVMSDQPVEGATTISETGWILPGLVDAHCHIGLGPDGAVDDATCLAQARADRDTGVLLIRDAGSPRATTFIDDLPGLPRLMRAGRHIARPKRYIKNYAVEIEPEDLPAEVARQAAAGDGWVKLIGDWIDRTVGDLTPLWPVELAEEAIAAAHANGAKVTAHCFGEESPAQLVAAGIDCVEHGTGLDEATAAEMARRGVALVPTLDNIEIFPGIADQAQPRYPLYAAHMRHLYERRDHALALALAAGVDVYAGTDAGGTRPHGTIGAELAALERVAGAEIALGAASWRSRRWLGRPCLEPGAPGDLIVVDRDPRRRARSAAEPAIIVVGGAVVSAAR